MKNFKRPDLSFAVFFFFVCLFFLAKRDDRGRHANTAREVLFEW